MTMKTYKVTIYPVTPWTVRVEAESEDEAKDRALELESPDVFSFQEEELDKWGHDIMEWPNIGDNGIVETEEE